MSNPFISSKNNNNHWTSFFRFITICGIFFLVSFMISCNVNLESTKTPTRTKTAYPSTAENLGLENDNPIEVINPIIITSLIADTTTLCPECQTTLKAHIENNNLDNLTYKWEAEYGQVEWNRDTAIYSPGMNLQMGGVDTVKVVIDDGKTEDSTSINL